MAEKITIRVSFGQAAVSMGIIGRVGENISRQILFDCSSAMTGRTSASIVCVVKRPTDSDPYPVSLTRVGSTDVYRLVLSSAEVAFAGSVQFELRMVDGDEILKAAICTGTVENSMTGIADVPGAAIPDVLNRLESVVEKAENFVELAEDIESATEAATAAAAAANAAMSDLSAFSGPPIIDTAKGLAFVFIEGASNRPLAGLRVFGRTQQNADPTPDAPVELVHVGASQGQITVAVNDDRAIVHVDSGLAGIPIDSEDAGNFVDSSGQRWICDEIDFARGVRIQRVARVVCGAENAEFFATGVWKVASSLGPRTTEPMAVMSTHYKASGRDTAPHGSVYVNLAGDIMLMNDKYTSEEVMREDLAANPVTVIFELQTPIETPLDEATLDGFAKFHTTEDEQTTILNTAAAEMEVDYVANTKAYVDGMVAKTQETATLELLETITISEADAGLLEIVRDSYTGMQQLRINCTTPAQEAAQNIFATVNMGGPAITIGGRAYYGQNLTGDSIFKMRQNAGYWDGEAEIGGASSTSTKYGQVGTGMVDVATHPEITKIRIYTFAPGFSAGTKFEIYGVMEDA